MPLVLLVAGLSAALDALVAGGVLLRGRGPVDAPRMLAAAGALALSSLVKAALLLALLPEPSLFLVVLLVYACLAAALPLLGVAVLRSARRREVRPAVRWTARLALLGVPVALWCSLVEPHRLEVEEVRVPLAAGRAGGAPLRIGVLADVQARRVTTFERDAVARLLSLRPDLILIPGDLAQVWPRAAEDAVDEFRALVAPLDAPLGVFMVLGNSDDPELVRRVLAGTRVRLLEDEIVELRQGTRRVSLCGIGTSYLGREARRAVAELEARGGEDDLRLLLCHFPDAFGLLRPGTRVDLLVAGHTHGGQVSLPLVGPPITLSSVPRRVAAGGLSDLDGRRLYVSRGVGVERGWAPQLRLGCPPEVSLLVLQGSPEPPSLAAGNLRSAAGGLQGPP